VTNGSVNIVRDYPQSFFIQIVRPSVACPYCQYFVHLFHTDFKTELKSTLLVCHNMDIQSMCRVSVCFWRVITPQFAYLAKFSKILEVVWQYQWGFIMNEPSDSIEGAPKIFTVIIYVIDLCFIVSSSFLFSLVT
jgi:hypothetical protein